MSSRWQNLHLSKNWSTTEDWYLIKLYAMAYTGKLCKTNIFFIYCHGALLQLNKILLKII